MKDNLSFATCTCFSQIKGEHAETRIEAHRDIPRHMAEERWIRLRYFQIVQSLVVALSDHMHIWTSAFQLQKLKDLPFTEKE